MVVAVVSPSPGARGRGGNNYKNHREQGRHQQRGDAGQPFFLVFNLENIFLKNKIPLTWRYWEAAALGNWPLTGKFTSEV